MERLLRVRQNLLLSLSATRQEERQKLLIALFWLVFLALMVLWLIGFAVDWGGFAWVLLGAAIVVLVFNIAYSARAGPRY